MPRRRPNSVRRTTSIDTDWPEGAGGPMAMRGAARDVLTAADGALQVLAEASFRIVASPMREIIEIETAPVHPGAASLKGVRAGGQSRAALGEVMAAEKAAGAPLYQILDDFAGASLVARWVWSQWETNWMERVGEPGAQDFMAKMANVCTGFADGSSAREAYGPGSRPEAATPVPPLVHPDDPAGWHALPELPGTTMRRARWIDLWREGEEIAVAAGFQDSGSSPAGHRVAVHEYRLTARVAADNRLLALEVAPHILPFAECPGAPAKALALIGQDVTSFRSTVLEQLPGTHGCTHLNDVLRALADVPALARQLPSQHRSPA